ncbi:MAG: CapA family protein [Deltaproteobacteria bacterium]|nr:CapA family protein [Deltaproteobacteria bacterium]
MTRPRAVTLGCVAGLSIALAFAACSRRPGDGASLQPVELWLGGDVHLGARTRRLFASKLDELAGAAGVVNLEGPVTERPEPSSARRLVNHRARLGVLRSGGVRVAGIANNHRSDLGAEGTRATVAALRSAGITAAGDGAEHGAGAGTFVQGGRRVVVAAVDLSAGAANDLRERLAAARAEGDVLVVSIHVVQTPTFLPGRELREAVGVAASAGARVVVAHGSHTYGPVERRGDTVIAWGLGNLVFDCDCSRERDGLLLRVSIDDESGVRARIVPIVAGLGGAPARRDGDTRRVLDLLGAMGSSPLDRTHRVGSF